MGDVLTLIEKAGAELDEEKAMQMADKMKKAQFDFEDYLMSMEQMRKMGGLSSIMSMMPGLGGLGGKNNCRILILRKMTRRWLAWKRSYIR